MSTVVPDIYNVITVTYIQASIFIWTHLRCYWRYHDNSMRVILQTWSQIQRTSTRLRYVNCGPGHIQWNDNTAYSGFNIQLNVSALLLDVSRQFNARYTANVVPYIAHTNQFTLCELWFRPYTMQVQFRMIRLQYSTELICAAIRGISTIQYALYCKRGAIYSAHPPVYAMWYVVPAIYSVITAPHIPASIFNWTYMFCYSRYLDNSKRFIL
jgi:hypothetical protein